MNGHSDIALVTGGAGFIGSELVSQLLAAGQRVIALDNLVNGNLRNFAGLPSRQLEFIEGDIRDVDLLREILPRVRIVYHLACLGVRHSLHSPEENHEINATGTLRVLEAARVAGVERFVYVSSSEIYGTAVSVPMDESHPANPSNAYGASKLAGEAYVRAAYERWHFPAVIVRPFNALGIRCHHEGDSGEVIPRFMLRALAGRPLVIFGDGRQTRDFTHVADTAQGIRLAGITNAAIGSVFNLGSEREYGILETAHAVIRAAGVPLPPIIHESARPGDVLRLRADSSRARRVLGFKPQISFPAALEQLADWYRRLPVSPEVLLEREVLHNWESANLSCPALQFR